MDKIISFDNSIERYRRLADERVERGDFLGALGYLFSAESVEPDNLGIITDIADTYADMDLYELSNQYWFYYLDKAPKSKASIAYEELAINFFYLDDLWASGYYFRLKISVDGYISREGLDDEIADFLSDAVNPKNAYHIAYPFDRADFSFRRKTARQALSAGNCDLACKIFSSIPKECLDEDASGEYAFSLLMQKKDEKMVEVCKNSLAIHGENTTAYCNLASLYKNKGDKEKSAYYYQKALESRKGNKSEAYKLATCAIDQGDDLTANECLKIIVDERPYDSLMRFFYAISFTNLKMFDKAKEEFSKSYKINPKDDIFAYYSGFINKLSEGGSGEEKLLPLRYEKRLPRKTETKYRKIIKDIATAKNPNLLKKKGVDEVIYWGLKSGETEVSKNCVFILTVPFVEGIEKVFREILLDAEVTDEVKRVIVFSLTVNGCKEKFGVVAGRFFVKVKPRKLVCEKKEDGEKFLTAYALCLAKSCFWNVNDLDKLGFSANKIYTLYAEKIISSEFTVEEISAIIFAYSKYEEIKSLRQICALFNVKYDVVNSFMKEIENKND